MNIDKIRKDFPALAEWTYLDNAFVGLIPIQVKEGYDEFVDIWMNLRVEGTRTILREWLAKATKVRGMIADFINANPKEIAFTMCTGSGLNIVINGTSWEKGDNVVFPEWEHNPLDTTTLRRNGVESRALPVVNGRNELSDLKKLVDDKTKLVQISQVGYINGFRIDLKEVTEIAHEHGAKVLIDATQAVGALKVDVKKMGVDYISAAPYKFLMGPGGLAFLYVKSENLDSLTPDRIGWKNQIWTGEHAEAPLEEPSTAEKFEYGTMNFQGVYVLEKSLEYLNALGIENVEKRVLNHTAHIWEKANELGKKMYTPSGTQSTIVSFYEERAVEVAAKLMTQKVKVTGREAHGGHIRVSPHFYNTLDEIDAFFEKYEKILS